MLLAAALAGGCASSPPPQVASSVYDDGLTTVRVKRELFQQEGVRLSGVDVSTQGGVVQLSGFVDSPEAARLAEQAALRAPGVRGVRNELRVAAPR